MKRIFALLLACWVLCLSVCADEIIEDSAPVEDSASVEDPVPVEDSFPVSDEVNDDSTIQTPAPVIPPVDSVVDVPVPSFTLDEVLSALPDGFGSPDVVSDDVVLTGVSRVSIPPVTPSSTTGLKAALLSVLGNYDPVVVVYQYNASSSGYSSYATDIQPDYVWIASAVLLCLVILCLFKLGGALLRG
nr:MAG TPA: hypothetical protein [Inoviridae sp.]